MESLSQEQTDKVLQFQDLTGVENLTVCRDVLQRHDWDLEVAVQDQLNINEGRPSVYASESTPPNVVNDTILQHVFFSPPTGYQQRWGAFGIFVSFAMQFCYSTFTSFLKFVYSLIFKDTRRMVTDPVGDVTRFLHHFNETYGRDHPVFYQGSYSQVLNDAKRELLFLLIYLHQDNYQDSETFARECLTNEDVIHYINTNMLFWGCNTRSEEGSRVASSLRASNYPFLGVIVLRESRMTLVGRMEGPVDATDFLTRMRAIVSANESCLEAARAERFARSLNQTIRREQDAAYLESLRQDQEKERRKNEEEEKRQREEKLRRELIIQEQQRKEAIQKKKLELVTEIPDEPEAGHPETVAVVFKLPSGERLERRFLKNHQLRDLYNYVFCHPSSPDSFEITKNFPKRTLPCLDEPAKTLIEAGIGRSEVLFISDLDA